MEKKPDKTICDIDDTITYTITATNTSYKYDCEDVVITDTLDYSKVYTILGSGITVDGETWPVGDDRWSLTVDQSAGTGLLTVNLGDIPWGKSSKIRFSVKAVAMCAKLQNTAKAEFKAVPDNSELPDAQKLPTEYKSESDTCETCVIRPGDKFTTGIHYQLTIGRGSPVAGSSALTYWSPNAQISLEEACTICYRLRQAQGYDMTVGLNTANWHDCNYPGGGEVKTGSESVGTDSGTYYFVKDKDGYDWAQVKLGSNSFSKWGQEYDPGEACRYWINAGKIGQAEVAAGINPFDLSKHIVNVCTLSELENNVSLFGTSSSATATNKLKNKTNGVVCAPNAYNTDRYNAVIIMKDNGTSFHGVATTPTAADLNTLIACVTGKNPGWTDSHVTRLTFCTTLLSYLGRLDKNWDYSACSDILGLGSLAYSDCSNLTSKQLAVVAEAANTHFVNFATGEQDEEWVASNHKTYVWGQ